jgi:hypothetical protein
VPAYKKSTKHQIQKLCSEQLEDIAQGETQEVVRRFLCRQLTFPECIAALDAALAGFIPLMLPEELPALRAVMLANNETVMKEMERLGRHRQSKQGNRPN